ncbi:MAG: hypothetical protein CG445_320, partial [Methanosaeta sp. ASM2]
MGLMPKKFYQDSCWPTLSNMPGDLTPIHGRGMMRHKPKPRGEQETL